MAAEGDGRILSPRPEVVGEAELIPQRRAGTSTVGLGPLGHDDLSGRLDHGVDVGGRDRDEAVVVDEHRVVGGDDDLAERGAVERIGRPRVLPPWASRQRSETEDRQPDPPQLRRVAVKAPHDDRGDAGGGAFERHEVANAALIEPAVVVDDEHPSAGVSTRPLEGLEEDVDRADMSDREGSAGDDGSWDDRPETDGSEAQRPLVADRGVRDRGGGDLLVLSPRSAIVSSHGAV